MLDALARLARGRRDDRRGRATGRREPAPPGRTRARLLPTTYAGHHAEHLLLHGDPRRALALAEADYRRRPYPATIVHYAYALWRTGDAARALEVVRRGEARGLPDRRHEAGRSARARLARPRRPKRGEALAEARRLNPRIDSPRQQFVVFGRD